MFDQNGTDGRLKPCLASGGFFIKRRFLLFVFVLMRFGNPLFDGMKDSVCVLSVFHRHRNLLPLDKFLVETCFTCFYIGVLGTPLFCSRHPTFLYSTPHSLYPTPHPFVLGTPLEILRYTGMLRILQEDEKSAFKRVLYSAPHCFYAQSEMV